MLDAAEEARAVAIVARAGDGPPNSRAVTRITTANAVLVRFIGLSNESSVDTLANESPLARSDVQRAFAPKPAVLPRFGEALSGLNLVERVVVLDALGDHHGLVGRHRHRPTDGSFREGHVRFSAGGYGDCDRAGPLHGDHYCCAHTPRVEQVDVVVDHARRALVEPVEVPEGGCVGRGEGKRLIEGLVILHTLRGEHGLACADFYRPADLARREGDDDFRPWRYGGHL